MTRAFRKTPMSVQELLDLPSTVDLVTAGNALGLSRTKSYQMYQDGEWPEEVPVLRLGKRFKVPTAPLLRYLGVERPPHDGHTPASTSGGRSSNTPAMRRSFDPSKRYRLRSTGEIVTGAELLRRRGES